MDGTGRSGSRIVPDAPDPKEAGGGNIDLPVIHENNLMRLDGHAGKRMPVNSRVWLANPQVAADEP